LFNEVSEYSTQVVVQLMPIVDATKPPAGRILFTSDNTETDNPAAFFQHQ
jgi:hypothetical protein